MLFEPLQTKRTGISSGDLPSIGLPLASRTSFPRFIAQILYFLNDVNGGKTPCLSAQKSIWIK